MATGVHSSYGDTFYLPEVRIVLLAYRNAGKRSAGNTILGREEFDCERTFECVKRQREVAGRHITVVSAPSWGRDISIEGSTELLKQEIVFSVTLCPPGPHAVLLVIPTAVSFTQNHRKVLEGYLKLISDRVWSHTIVLFTAGDFLEDRTIEQHIESEGKDLQWLVEKCGNRYHVLNNKNRSDDSQVTELLEKIEEMVAENGGHHFELDSKIPREVEEKKREQEERAKERVMKVQRQREDIKSKMGASPLFSDLRIVLLGYRYSGKSSAGNTILNREEFELKRTAQCVKRQRQVAQRHITVVEAPGSWKNKLVENCCALFKQEILLSMSLCPPGPHTFLLVIRVDSSFKETDRKAIEGYLKLLTDTVWSHTIVLFTCGDCLGDTPIEQHIEREGKDLQWLVEKCGNRYHVLNNKNRSDDSQVTELLEKIEEMVAANSGRHFEMDRKILQEVEEKRRAEEERVKERMMKVQKQREEVKSKMGDTLTPELRIVLMGYKGCGKSTVGNAIFSSKEFDLNKAAQNVKREGLACGRQITVVEADWQCVSVEESSKLYRGGIMESVCLCSPGPHALLLVLRMDSDFKDIYRKAVVEHLELFGENIWSHTVVVFTFGDWLGDMTIEQHIESEGKNLQWLVEKCGNRYHAFNSVHSSEGTQLLEKIEEMVAANGGRHFEIPTKIREEVEEKRKTEERSELRRMEVQKKRELIKRRIELQKGQHVFEKSSESGTKEFDIRFQEERQALPPSSRVSMRSDGSLGIPLNFRGKIIPELQSSRFGGRSSPFQSYRSMKSDQTPGAPYAERLGCFVCRGMLRDAVTLPCGHASCMQCTQRDYEGTYTCLQCQIESRIQPEFHQYPATANMFHPIMSTAASPPIVSYAGPGDIACDMCSGRKLKAMKSCLTCTVSFCEEHARPHYTVAALQRHILVEATEDLQQKLCQLHHRALEVFCKTDQTHICTMCLALEHRGHDIDIK